MKKAANPSTEKAAKAKSIAWMIALSLLEYTALVGMAVVVLAVVLEVGA